MNDLVIGGLILVVMCGALCWFGMWALRKGIKDGLANKPKDEWEHEIDPHTKDSL